MEPIPFDLTGHLQQHGAALRRLARELVHDRASIDDALQETWLRALRMPPRHEGHLGGWLATILRNVVGRERRGERRRVRRERAAPVRDHAESPVDRLERSEVVRRLLTAVDALDPAQRDVIWQRYFEGLPPREIVRRTGVPLLTVKSRLQRGLQQLRERLGEGGESSDWRSALVFAFGFELPQGAATVATVAAWQGGLLMASGAKLAVAVGVVALAVWWLRPTVPAPGSSTAAVEPPQAAVAEASLPPLVRAEPAAPAAPAAAAERPVAASPGSAPPATARVLGRVVAAETGQPIAGVELYRRRGIGDIRWEPDETLQVTGPDGRFGFELRADRAPGLMLRAPGRLTCYWSGSMLAAGKDEELGDLPLTSGRSVTGRLVDTAGAPVAASVLIEAVELERTRAPRQGRDPGPAVGLLQPLPAQVQSDGDGRFVTPRPLAFGRCAWSIPAGEFELVGSVEAVLEPGDGPQHVELVVRRRPEIRGRVTDDLGVPIAAVHVRAEHGGRSVTDAAGRFALVRLQGAEPSCTLAVAAAAEFAPLAPLTSVPWGAADVHITLRRAVGFHLEVTDPDGVPIEEFGVVVDRDGLSQRGVVQQRARHPAGALSVLGVVPGVTRLRVVPTAREWTPSELLATTEATPMRVVLPPRLPAAVRVRAAGEPVALATVRLLHEHERGGGLVDPTGERAWVPGRGGWELVDEGTTDTTGEVALLRDQDSTGRVLQVEVPGRRMHVVDEPSFPADGAPLLVDLPSLGAITGRVTLRDVPRDDVRVVLHGGRNESCTPDPDGSFAFRDLAPGSHQISLQRSPGERLGTVIGSERSIEITAGETTEVAFDIADYPLAHVRGRVRADGPLPPGLVVDCVRRMGASRPEPFATAVVAADGSFHVADLLPGDYLFAFRTRPEREAWLPGLQADVISLPGGGEVVHELTYRPRRLVVRFWRPEGTSADGQAIVARCGGEQWPGILFFQARIDGPLILDPAPELPIEFRCAIDGARWSAPVVVPPDRADAEVTVVLPDPPTPR